MKISNYRIESGEYAFTFTAEDEGIINSAPSDGFIAFSDVLSPEAYYYNALADALKPLPPRPSEHHAFDYALKQWIDPRTLDDFKAAALQAGAAELARRLYLPITVGGSPFDADQVSRDRITHMRKRLQEGRGLPPEWMGWRDASNAMHWADATDAEVLAHLTALSEAIENREQSLLVTGWTLKAQIEAAATVDQVQAIAWPD